jgi:hypothetical protein
MERTFLNYSAGRRRYIALWTYIFHPNLRQTRSKQFIKNWESEDAKQWAKNHSVILTKNHKYGKIKVWNKGLKGEDYKNHYKNGFASSKRKGRSLQELFGKEKADKWIKNITNNIDIDLLRTNGKRLYTNGKCAYCIGAIGEKSLMWMGGKSFEPYSPDFNIVLRREVKNRDKMCMLCNKTYDKLTNKQIQTHHIDYDKKNSKRENLVILCASCHMKTNINRDYWKIFFQTLLSEKYKYSYNSIKS